MKKIMVRADDLGFSKAINYGIYETVKNGVIKNIGFMVNMTDSLHGYELVKDYDICLGQHTNVCVGKPISDPKDIPTLVNADGTCVDVGRVTINHKNIPNMISQFTKALGDAGVNISNMTNKSKGDFAYTMIDVSTPISSEVTKALKNIQGVYRVRVIK